MLERGLLNLNVGGVVAAMSPEDWSTRADHVAIAHLAYAGFIVLALIAILIGYLRKWKWVRHFWFRAIHLLMIGIVVAEAWLGITCPLTTWEISLRDRAGQGFDGTPIAQFVHSFLFYDASWWVFTMCYTACGLLIVSTLVLVPPQLPFRFAKNGSQDEATA